MRRVLHPFVIVFLGYLFIALVIIPPTLNYFIPKIFIQLTGRVLHSDAIVFNPFRLSLTLRHVSIKDPDDQQFIGFDKASVNLSLSSLWRPSLHLDNMQLHGLTLDIKKLDDKHFNFSDILLALETAIPNEHKETNSDNSTFPLTIDNVELSAKRIIYTDKSRPDLFTSHLSHLHFQLQSFSTIDPKGQPYRLTAVDEANGTLQSQGHISLAAAYSKGQWSLKDISLAPVSRLLSPILALSAKRAKLDFDTHYQLNWQDKPIDYQLKHGTLRLHDVNLQAKEDEHSQLDLKTLLLSKINIHHNQQYIQLDSLLIDGLHLRGWNQGHTISLAKMFSLTDKPPPTVTTQPTTANTPWQLQLNKVKLINSNVQWHTDSLSQQQLSLQPTLTIENIHWPESQSSSLRLQLKINHDVTISSEGQWTPATGNAALNGKLVGLPLNWLNPVIAPHVDIAINDGLLNLDWHSEIQALSPVTAQINGSIDQFTSQQQSRKKPLVHWEHLAWENLHINIPQQQLTLQQLSLSELSGYLQVHKDGSTNLQSLIRKSHQAPPHHKEKRQNNRTAWAMTIQEIKLKKSLLAFQDYSHPQTFHTKITQLSGQINDISTDSAQQARIKLTAAMDGYSPINIHGTMQPLLNTPTLDMGLAFEHIDLSRLTPYASNYTGYAIDKGLLDLTLKYQLHDQQLLGSNHVIIDQLNLEKQTQKSAQTLPLPLATALLSDENGIIDLNVDISGNIDDPNFHLGGVLWQAFRNLIVKAVSAPFQVLTQLAGSSDELEFIEMATGSPRLNNKAQNTLSTLIAAMAHRPQLRLGIIGTYDESTDTQALQQRQLHQQWRAQGLSDDSINNHDHHWEKQLNQQFQQQFPGIDIKQKTWQQQEQALRQTYAVNKKTLQHLADQRALAIKRYLIVTLKAPADKIFIEKKAIKESTRFAGVKMTIDV